jgi:hypothetical protein
MRLLMIHFSQSGDGAKVADALAESLQGPGVRIDRECIRPVEPYPFPWRSVFRFFNVLPECHLGPAPAIRPPAFDTAVDYDLVVLVYPVWFLCPSLPVQGFLNSPAASVLWGRKVLTVSVSRNMWQSASEAIKFRLRALWAHQIDNIVVTHQGPPWATFITAPRLLLYGKKDAFWKVFPAAGLAEAELDRVRRLGGLLRDRLPLLRRWPQSLLRGAGAVTVNRRYLLPELLGWYVFRGWAHLLKLLGRLGPAVRYAGIAAFILFLATAVVVGIPVVVLVSTVLYPLVRALTRKYAERLAEPSGEVAPAEEQAARPLPQATAVRSLTPPALSPASGF